MSGHNKWSSIKHRKGAQDAKRGKAFTKISKELTVAARIGGGDASGNPRLRLAIANARAASMPSDTMSRAIKKGTGELDGGSIEELAYEGYGPGGVGFIIEAATDNQNRTLSEVRNILEKSGGSLAKNGAVSFNFARKGCIRIDASKIQEDQLMEAALDAGADDVTQEDDAFVVYTAPASFHAVKEALDARNIESVSAELSMIPNTTVRATDAEQARKMLRLIERLEDNEDVQNVWVNFEVPDEIAAQLDG
ncbi:MAG: YebC/PmpR family DNA-binding transcriptional regulator [Deltaproteobacteria bacterium]|nr:YebC/PmpR family DNA-binding transcriptional regulator [Deltaproteobacteria bacterium]